MRGEGEELGTGLPTATCSRTWLDILPTEVFSQVASCLSCGDQRDPWAPLLPLAETSSLLCDAVKSLLHTIPSDCSIRGRRWRKLFGLVEDRVDLREHMNRDRSVAQILGQRAWRKARMWLRIDDAIEIHLDWDSPLSLLIIEEPLDRGVNSFLLIARSVDELSVMCGCVESAGKEFCFVGRAMEGVVTDAIVRNLDLDCFALRKEGLEALITSFSRLREFTFFQDSMLTDAMVDQLRQVESIHIGWLRRTEISTVFKLAHNLISLHFHPCVYRWQCFSSEEVEELSVCTKVKRLQVSIQNGAEVAVDKLPLTLRELRLTGVGFRDAGYKLKSRAIVEYAQRCTNLSVLRLSNMSMSVGDLVTILEWMGARLKKFQGCLCYEDSTVEALITIVEQLVISNPNVLTFMLSVAFSRPPVKEELTLLACRKADKLRAMFRVLCRRVPRLDVSSLAEAIRSGLY